MSLATLAGAAAAIYKFFTSEVAGGVKPGVRVSRKKKTAGLLTGVLGYVALALLVIALYFALDARSFYEFGGGDLFERSPTPDSIKLITLSGAVAAAAMLLMPVRWFLNFFSIQVLYRRGLAKAFAIKSTPAGVEPRGRRLFRLSQLRSPAFQPDVPYHLIVTALNTSGDHQLERLGRRSDAFVMAHLHSGSRLTGYEPTHESPAFRRVSLTEAMAISGAAQSPNMGRGTNTSRRYCSRSSTCASARGC